MCIALCSTSLLMKKTQYISIVIELWHCYKILADWLARFCTEWIPPDQIYSFDKFSDSKYVRWITKITHKTVGVLVFTTFEYVKRIAMNTNILIFYFITLNLFWNSFRKGILKQQMSDPTLLKSTQNYFYFWVIYLTCKKYVLQYISEVHIP